MGKTIGEIQDAIESISKPESDDEQELGIGTDARARLAAQAQMANEKKNKRTSDGVNGLVYSDESDDDEDHRQSLGPLPSAPSILQPPLPLPTTPPLGNAEISSKPPSFWTVNEVVDWARAKGFDDSIWQKFKGELADIREADRKSTKSLVTCCSSSTQTC